MVTNHFPPRILLAKIGLDGHDRGVKVLARSFRDAGLEVIYTGLWQTCEATMHAALQEDVDVVGVSLLSAAHMTVMPQLMRIRRQLNIEWIPIILGGIVPVSDHRPLLDLGIAAVFNPGSAMDAIVAKIRELAEQGHRPQLKQVLEGYSQQHLPSLARIITAIQREEDLGGWTPPAGRARVIGVTGAPGVGKSSCIGQLGAALRARGKSVAVVAVDPSSPITGGALLGDRLRMMAATPDDKFFVRSLASGRSHGGLSPHCREIVRTLAGFGFDFVLVETVGAGQGDVAIRDLTEHVLLIMMPESGDSIQFSKAGIMEIAHAVVVNKCDLPGADRTLGQLQSVLHDARPIFRVSTVRREGIAAVADWAESLVPSQD